MATFSPPVSTLDILPTCLAAAGLPLPSSPKPDGVNLLPLIDDTAPATPPARDLFWWWKSGPLKGGWAMRTGKWKLYQEPGEKPAPVQLFDLATDPQEKTNLAVKSPEKVTALKQVFDTWAADVEADAAQPVGAKESAQP